MSRVMLKEKLVKPWGEIRYHIDADMRGKIELLKRIIDEIKPDNMFIFDNEIVFTKDGKDIRVVFDYDGATIYADKSFHIDKLLEVIPEFDDEEVDEYSKWGE